LFDKVGAISLADTTFSWLNVFVTVLLILILPISLYFLGKKVGSQPVLNLKTNVKDEDDLAQNQWLDKSNFLGVFTGASILLYWCFLNFQKVNEGVSVLSIINLQTTNILLLGLCFLMHGSLANFTKALEKAIGGASSILIQFPLYFGILGMVQQSGLNVLLSNLLSSASSELYLSIYTFFSAGLLNVFVPSGGGQWQLQGVIIVEAAQKINADLPKLIMAFCYGDQLTNMLQPFWALPLLGITGLKAREILPYSLLIFVIGLLVFLLGLIIF
jgi:short-chain fatty acids transporter